MSDKETTTTTTSSDSNPTGHYKTWSISQVYEWAKASIGDKDAQKLTDNEIQGVHLDTLTETNIQSILPLGPAISLLAAIKQLNLGVTSTTDTDIISILNQLSLKQEELHKDFKSLKQTIEKEQSIYQASSISNKKFEKIKSKFGLTLDEVVISIPSSLYRPNAIPPYQWAAKSESDQMVEVKAWFNEKIPLPNSHKYEDIHNTDYLNTQTIKGSCDMIVVPSNIRSKIGKQNNILIAIELKKPATIEYANSINQGFAQLIQASTLSKLKVLHIRTDLNDTWWFSWFSSDNEIKFTALNRDESLFFINYFLCQFYNLTVQYKWTTKTFIDFKNKTIIEPIVPKKLDIIHENTDIGNLTSLYDFLDENERLELLVQQRTKDFFNYNNLYS